MFDNDSLEAYLQIAGVITQAELPIVQSQGRLGEYAVAYRIYRNKQGGGFGDRSKRPYAWAILVYVDGLPLRINSARGDCREWSTLEIVSEWMIKNGFRYWWTRNDLEWNQTELAAPETVISEAAIPEAAIPEAAIPEAAIPEAAIPEAAIPEAAIPEAAIPEAAIPEAAIPEAAIPEAIAPDTVIPEAAIPDTIYPEGIAPLEPAIEIQPDLKPY